MMNWFEIYETRGLWVIWKWTGDVHAERIKSFKTKKSAENWAAKQWLRVIWR